MEALGPQDPRQVGEYRLLRRLGAGGMGTVYLGRNTGGRTVAVKVVHGEFAQDEEFRRRFRQEVRAARTVGGRWTAPVLDADTEGPLPWVATGYVAGPALGQAVREFGPLNGAAVRTLGAGLADALGAVHGLGLVHRDVKPSNVMLALDGPRLIDFGIARAMDAAGALTQSGYVVGSPGFMSPEQARGDQAGPPSDVFSLGAVLAFAATGTAPFGEGVSAAVLLYRVLNETPELGPLEGDLRRLVLDCLAKEPADRPTPAELRERLNGGPPGTMMLGQVGWLPPMLAESMGRLAAQLLELDTDPRPAAPPVHDAVPPGAFGPPTPPTPVPAPPATPPLAPRPSPYSELPAAPTTPAGYNPGPYQPPNPYQQNPYQQQPYQQQPYQQPFPSPAPTPYPPTAAPAPGGNRTRTVLIAAGAAVVVAGAAVLAYYLTGHHAAPQPAPLPTPTPSPVVTSDSPTPPPSPSPDGALAAGFPGNWTGSMTITLNGRSDPVTYQISLVQGAVGQVVGQSSTTYPTENTICNGADTLVSADDTTMVLSEAGTTGTSGCGSNTAPDTVTLRLNSDGTLEISQDGFTPAALTRQQ
ncbi:serine/threonine-protein kinase [Kitasatospora viridis]|uniref:Serine/threonine protein kinase n=1 Tax=Kitasatospora viridis TaxID=281105 RepID=A0A561UPM7_9ACTN|nr:serine/threonine-protein kinase [Kitasatospora viridis]TWG01323.1 serine/threonine protein kinase [Kitasatospora viridis]